jgi:hypothetical protein
MNCPKCGKDTATLVTTEARTTVQERKGIILWILLFPFMLVYHLFRICFGKRQRYYKKTYWHCNYCNYDWDQEIKQDMGQPQGN